MLTMAGEKDSRISIQETSDSRVHLKREIVTNGLMCQTKCFSHSAPVPNYATVCGLDQKIMAESSNPSIILLGRNSRQSNQNRLCAAMKREGRRGFPAVRFDVPSAPNRSWPNSATFRWPLVLYSKESGLAARLPMRAFNRIFTRRCRFASLISECSEAFYLEAFDSTHQVFALLFPESELRLISSMN